MCDAVVEQNESVVGGVAEGLGFQSRVVERRHQVVVELEPLPGGGRPNVRVVVAGVSGADMHHHTTQSVFVVAGRPRCRQCGCVIGRVCTALARVANGKRSNAARCEEVTLGVR